ncbi:histidine acid phosphatase superfamily protein [Cystoisospora suis]|uniref:Histidine acid phosphatase superfamily protein n=1 Tax=Cystoisospora suis TaxID=483139 RepID=A0A2C6KMB3_9APIC|nr:histidine acid phosphatase superfamily protein [Cystoisospora suis]
MHTPYNTVLFLAALGCLATADGGSPSPRTCWLNPVGTAPSYPVADTISPAAPPALPSDSSLFDFLFVLQRHGARAPLKDTGIFPVSGTAIHGGQLTPQGAHELHVSGEEVREYLVNSVSETCRIRENQNAGYPDSACGVGSLSPDRVFVRATAVPRTHWSALAFLEGFYKLPYGCVVSIEDLSRETGRAHPTHKCVRLAVSLDVQEKYDSEGEDASTGPVEPSGSGFLPRSEADVGSTSLRVGGANNTAGSPGTICVHAPHLRRDGIAAGMTEASSTAELRRELAAAAGRDADWIPTSERTRRALAVVSEVFPETEKLGAFQWVLWDRFLAERAAAPEGTMTPSMRRLYEWVAGRQPLVSEKETEGAYGELQARTPAASFDRAGAPEVEPSVEDTYKALLSDIEHMYYVGFRFRYGTPDYSFFSASGLILLANGMLRVKAYRRLEDVESLRRILVLLGGFNELLGYDEATADTTDSLERALETLERRVKELEMMLFSGHDSIIMSFLASIGVFEEGLLPYASKVYIELTSAPATNGLDVGGISTAREQYTPQSSLADVESGWWPETSHSVRLLLGRPGQAMRVLALPFCTDSEKPGGACPLAVWLRHTYARIDGFALHQRASFFKHLWKAINAKPYSV